MFYDIHHRFFDLSLINFENENVGNQGFHAKIMIVLQKVN